MSDQSAETSTINAREKEGICPQVEEKYFHFWGAAVLELCAKVQVAQETWRRICNRRNSLYSKDANSPATDRWKWLNELSDEQLAASLVAGEQDALAVLFDRYHKLVFSVAMRIVNDAGEAEEVVQTVFLDFFRGLASFDPQKGMLKVWLLQYAYHRALNRKRYLAASRFYRWVDLDSASTEPLLSWTPGHVTEAARLMEQLMSSLSAKRRRILELTYFEGMTADEVAVKLGESVNVVRHELYRALAKLRNAVAQEVQTASEQVVSREAGAMKANA